MARIAPHLVKLFALLMLSGLAQSAVAQAPATAPVERLGAGSILMADGVVEAVRQSVVAAQVAGAIVALQVKAGDRVQQGQLLLRIDDRAASQNALAGAAQAASAEAVLVRARSDLARSLKLRDAGFISAAAHDRAEADFKAAQADANAQLARARAAQAESGFYVVRAPYAAIVSAVAVELGDMATPGRPMLTLYAPENLRVTATVAQNEVSHIQPGAPVRVQIPSLSGQAREFAATSITVLPAADPNSQTVQVRLGIPAATAGLVPGMFARAGFAIAAGDKESGALTIPARAVVKRAELQLVYVVGDGKTQIRPQLRQVRTGHQSGERIEILAGLNPGEVVALDPLAAAQQR